MKKFVILNCPAYSYNEQLPGFDGCLCREFEGLIKKCAERENCIMKQIVGLCKEKIKVCEGCSKTADINIDCVECDEKGEANISRAIVNLLEIEEVDE